MRVSPPGVSEVVTSVHLRAPPAVVAVRIRVTGMDVPETVDSSQVSRTDRSHLPLIAERPFLSGAFFEVRLPSRIIDGDPEVPEQRAT